MQFKVSFFLAQDGQPISDIMVKGGLFGSLKRRFGTKIIINPMIMTLQESNLQIIEQLAAGKTIKEIAIVLNMSNRTVEDRIYNLRKKENCSTVTQLVMKMLNPVFGRMAPSS